jgi:hypothetical protein
MSGIIIPSSLEDRAKIKKCMEELSNSFSRTESERDFVKDALLNLSEEVDIPKKVLSKMAKIYHKQNIAEVIGDFADISELYDIVMS